MKKKTIFRMNIRLSVIMAGTLLLTSTGVAMAKDHIIIYHAGSLSVPLEKMEEVFESANPSLDIIRKSGGSTKMARFIAEQNEPADIMASADYTVIDKILIPEKASWNIRFATNQLVLCYTDKSRYADEVHAHNWYNILNRKGVAWGHSDPDLDPCGYRSLILLQLAEIFHKKPGLYDYLIANRPPENVKPKADELVALLKSGDMDYAWEYLSVAVQHGLKYVTLDDHINLGSPQYDDFYKQAEVKVNGKEPGTWITHRGRSCTYGITLINDTPNTKGAVRFLEYLLSPEGGLALLKKMGQPPFIPCRVESEAVRQSLPRSLSNLVEVSN
jgi:molybdate/tungstate transport system substrate-binding protein